jgi:hypothetical protein
MDFDHIGSKEANISALMSRSGLDRLVKEIAKCEVVCANCHRIRTQARLERKMPEKLGERELTLFTDP